MSIQQVKIERGIEAALAKINSLTEYVEDLKAQLEILRGNPDQQLITFSSDPHLDIMADHFMEIQLMTFQQFMQAVETERIAVNFTVAGLATYPLLRRNAQ